MVSFAEINQDANLSANSTILNLFATSSAAAPPEMTRWDKALLRGLYTSDHRSRMQMSQMETRAIDFLQSKPSPEDFLTAEFFLTRKRSVATDRFGSTPPIDQRGDNRPADRHTNQIFAQAVLVCDA